MKLRNKKTGEIMDDVQYRNYSLPNGFGFRMDGKEWEYHSLAELNADWEDYTPQEPLIKDEKIRETLRAWAEINNITMVTYDAAWNAFRRHDYSICFDYDFDIKDNFEDNGIYTIGELCGEEDDVNS